MWRPFFGLQEHRHQPDWQDPGLANLHPEQWLFKDTTSKSEANGAQELSDELEQLALERPFFKYESLGSKQIRLLKIHPGAFEDDLVCEIRSVDWHSRPDYTAISYTWGNQSTQHQIRMNNLYFNVHANCLYALQQARYFLEENSFVWIDAICINQEDLEEKGHQVSFMGKIYQQAMQVFACVGKNGVESTSFHVGLLATQSQSFEELWKLSEGTDDCERCAGNRFQGPDRRLCHVVHQWLASINVDELYALYDAAEIVSCSPYWTRLWIVQEIFLATSVRVLCDHRMVWMQFLFALDMVKENINGNDHFLRSLADSLGFNDTGKPQLLRLRLGTKLLGMCSYRELGINGNISDMDDVMELGCSNPRDRVFGLMHLQPWPQCTGPPTPSYTKSRLEVITDYFRHKGLSYQCLREIGKMLHLLSVPDNDCWVEVHSRLYRTNLDDSSSVLLASSSMKQCTRDFSSLPGRFRICGARVCYHVFQDTDGSLRTCIPGYSGFESKAVHICPKIEVNAHLHALLDQEERSRTYSAISILGECEEGDLLLTSDTHDFYGFKGARPSRGLGLNVIFVVRRAPNDYFAVVGISAHQRVSLCDSGSACLSTRLGAETTCDARNPDLVELYSNVEDTINFVLHFRSLKRLKQICARQRRYGGESIQDLHDLPGFEQVLGVHRVDRNDTPVNPHEEDLVVHFPHSPFSTFGVQIGPNNQESYRELKYIAGIPSIDGRTVPCASCGGLFEPQDEDSGDNLSDLPGISPYPLNTWFASFDEFGRPSVKAAQKGHMIYRPS